MVSPVSISRTAFPSVNPHFSGNKATPRFSASSSSGEPSHSPGGSQWPSFFSTAALTALTGVGAAVALNLKGTTADLGKQIVELGQKVADHSLPALPKPPGWGMWFWRTIVSPLGTLGGLGGGGYAIKQGL
jgi:hypothetical protein